MSEGPSRRTTLKRGVKRAVYDPDTIRAILASGMLAHVGVTTDDGPIVLPMVFGVRDDELLIHGSVANAMMRAGRSFDVCVTVTIVDGLVVARTPLHNSMNYRSVVVRGQATMIEDEADKVAALKIINDHITALWDTARAPSEADLRQTMVLSVPLVEYSAKVRSGDPVDEPEDIALGHWAGVVPLETRWGKPYAAADLIGDVPVPEAVIALGDSNAHPGA